MRVKSFFNVYIYLILYICKNEKFTKLCLAHVSSFSFVSEVIFYLYDSSLTKDKSSLTKALVIPFLFYVKLDEEVV